MIDGAALINNLLSDSWTNSNTNSRTPTIKEWYEYEREIGVEDKDRVLVYDRDSLESPASFGNIVRQVVYSGSIDLRTDYSKNQGLLMENEAKRILRNNVNYIVGAGKSYGTANQQVQIEIIRTSHFSNNRDSETNKIHKNFRKIIDFNLTSFGEAI